MPKPTRDRDPRLKRIIVHGLRVAIFVAILCMIRQAHRQVVWNDANLDTNPVAVDFVIEAIEGGSSILPDGNQFGGNPVSNETGQTVGYVLQTSPDCDHIIGYSGPTNCLIALDSNNEIQSIAILRSGDTVDHVAAVKSDPGFAEKFKGIGFGESQRWHEIDAVSGATLTSYAIISSIANRMGGKAPSLKFKNRPAIENVRTLFGDVSRINSTGKQNVWDVFFHSKRIGYVVSTTPYADQISGYQGPTMTLAGFDDDDRCIGLFVDQTYENDPYARYLNDDRYFQSLYVGKTLEELAAMDPETEGIDGVSGATMTSVCVADGLFEAAKKTIQDQGVAKQQLFSRSLLSFWADVSTVLLTVIGVAFSFGWFRKNKTFRLIYQFAVLAFLGFVNGHMLSQASIAGWATHSIPWTIAPGLVFLSFAAVLVPIASKHQPYCHHVCPFGALQQLAKNRTNWKISIAKPVDRVLQSVPFLLLLLVVVVAVTRQNLNLASIEPFDGFAFRIAGGVTIGIFVVGLAFSVVSPMAYCRYGCPTGALLGFLKFRSDSHKLGTRDWLAMLLLALAVGLSL